MARGGRTVLFVSHNMNAVERFCGRVLWIDRGALMGPFRDAREGIAEYLKSSGKSNDRHAWYNDDHQFESNYFRPEWCKVYSTAPRISADLPFPNDHPIVFAAAGQIRSVDPAFNLGIGVYDETGTLLFWSMIS